MLLVLLGQHFGSRLEARKRYEPVYGRDGGYDEDFKGYVVSLDALHDSELKFLEAMQFFNKSSEHQFVTGKVAKMRLVLARRKEGDEDIEMLCATYVEYLQKYPMDIVNNVVEEIITTKKFFPLVSEILPRLEELNALRKALLLTFEGKRDPSKKEPEMKASFNRDDYYLNPKENPLRRTMCDFLVSKGEPDWYGRTTAYSNYQLEGLCRKHGWSPSETPTPPPPVAPLPQGGGDGADFDTPF